MGACFLTYVAQWPYLARQAFRGLYLQTSLAASLLAWLLIAPLLLYVVAILVYFLHRVLGGGKIWTNQSGSLLVILAATPVMMLFGLVKGFLGSGTAENVVGFFGLCPIYFILCAVVRAKVGGAAQ